MIVLAGIVAIVSVSALMITAIVVSERKTIEAERARADRLESIVRHTVGSTEDLVPRPPGVPSARTARKTTVDPHLGDGS